MTQVDKARLDAEQIDEQLQELQQASHTSIQQLEAKIKVQSVISDQLQQGRSHQIWSDQVGSRTRKNAIP